MFVLPVVCRPASIAGAEPRSRGQLPAFEWNFSDVNPPVHAWASWRVYQMDPSLHACGVLGNGLSTPKLVLKGRFW